MGAKTIYLFRSEQNRTVSIKNRNSFSESLFKRRERSQKYKVHDHNNMHFYRIADRSSMNCVTDVAFKAIFGTLCVFFSFLSLMTLSEMRLHHKSSANWDQLGYTQKYDHQYFETTKVRNNRFQIDFGLSWIITTSDQSRI